MGVEERHESVLPPKGLCWRTAAKAFLPRRRSFFVTKKGTEKSSTVPMRWTHGQGCKPWTPQRAHP
ncbi:MAG: hypothetical protein DBX59_00945 [Bacillota bacterium]|nr:MAG: hypothetical protein DBX59_00945 [Bacillota bacterium]